MGGLPTRSSAARRGPWGIALVVVATVVAGLLAAAPAAAQETSDSNSLQSITPANGDALAQSPTAIVLAFNQELKNDDLPLIDRLTCDGVQQDTARIAERDEDNLVATFAINHELPRGICIIEWRLTDALGATITEGTVTFRIDADPSSVPPDASAATTAPTPGSDITYVTVPPADLSDDEAPQGSSGGALWLGRFASALGIMLVFGGLALIGVGWPEGPEYIVTVRYLRAVWLLAVLGTVLYVVALTASTTGRSFGGALNPTAWLDLLDEGWPGRGALLRLALVLATWLVAWTPEKIIDPTSQMWAWAVPAATAASVALGRVDGPAAWLGVLAGAAHVIAAAVWLGGAALVARVVLAGPGDDDLVMATRAFGRISVPAVALAVLTGLGQTLRLDGAEVLTSGHGQVVLLKVIAVAVMVFVAVAARQQVGLRLAGAQEMSVSNADRFRRAFGAEATLGVVVLAFSGWLLSLTPPKADPLAGERYAATIEFVDPATGLDVDVSIGPAKVGRNGIKVVVNAPETGVTGLRLTFTPPEGTSGEARFVVQQDLPNTGVGTSWLPTRAGLPLLAPGTWTVALSGATEAGVSDPMLRTLLIADGDGGVVTQPPVQTQPNVSVSLVDNTQPQADFASTTTAAPPVDPLDTTTVPSG